MTRQILASRVILIATPDDEIAIVGQELARIGEEELRGKVVLHTSGAMDSRVLDALQMQGATVGSMHPLQSFSGVAVPSLEGKVFTIEGETHAVRVARQIARALGGSPVHIAGSKKSCITRQQRWPPVMCSRLRKPPCSCSSRLG